MVLTRHHRRNRNDELVVQKPYGLTAMSCEASE
jgi:hypothetical protein